MSIIKVDYGTVSGGGIENREINFKLYPFQTYTYNGKFNTAEYESFKILITKIDHSNYPLTLAGSNDDSTYTTIKTWNTAFDYYEEIINLCQGYKYFWLYGVTTNSYGARILVRAISNNSNREINYRMYVAGPRSDYNASYITKDYEKFEIYITKIDNTSYPVRLYASNSGVNYTLKKSWTTAHISYEDITDLIKDYEYFYFDSSNASYGGRIKFRAITI